MEAFKTSGDEARALDPADAAIDAGRLGAAVAADLTTALEQLERMGAGAAGATQELKSLLRQVERVRRVGMISQQVSRIRRGEFKPSIDHIELTQQLRDAASRWERPDLLLQIAMEPANVVSDGPLTVALLDALLAWAAGWATGMVDVRLVQGGWPIHPRLTLTFPHQESAWREPQHWSTADWSLVVHAGRAMGVNVELTTGPRAVIVSLNFFHMANPVMNGVRVIDLGDAAPSGFGDSGFLVGGSVLVASPRKPVRRAICNALRGLGLTVEAYESLDEARKSCSRSLPHAVVCEAAFGDEALAQFRSDLRSRSADLRFVSVAEGGADYQCQLQHGHAFVRLAREGLDLTLPLVMRYELKGILAP